MNNATNIKKLYLRNMHNVLMHDFEITRIYKRVFDDINKTFISKIIYKDLTFVETYIDINNNFYRYTNVYKMPHYYKVYN